MPMTRSGLSSLMGYQEGGGVDLADIPDAKCAKRKPVQ
jgi:hypothetical protein